MAVPPAHRIAWGRLGLHSPCRDQPAATFPAAIGLVVVGQPPAQSALLQASVGGGFSPHQAGPPWRPTMCPPQIEAGESEFRVASLWLRAPGPLAAGATCLWAPHTPKHCTFLVPTGQASPPCPPHKLSYYIQPILWRPWGTYNGVKVGPGAGQASRRAAQARERGRPLHVSGVGHFGGPMCQEFRARAK